MIDVPVSDVLSQCYAIGVSRVQAFGVHVHAALGTLGSRAYLLPGD